MTVDVVFEGVSVVWRRTVAIDDFTAVMPAGRFAVLVGPNGSGKSSLLKTLYGAARVHGGSVRLGDTALDDLRPQHRARRIGVLSQHAALPPSMTGYEVVTLGRYPRLGFLGRPSPADRAAIDAAIEMAECSVFIGRALGALSGGEQQRILLARALAGDPEVLVLDEPTNHLDPGHQLAILELAARGGRTVIAALHSLDLAAAYADVVFVLERGRLRVSGRPEEVLVPGVIASVFGVDALPIIDPESGRHRLLVRGSAHTSGSARGSLAMAPRRHPN